MTQAEMNHRFSSTEASIIASRNHGRLPTWSGSSVQVETTSACEAMEKAGLDYGVGLQRLRYMCEPGMLRPDQFVTQEIMPLRAVVSCSGDPKVLGVVGKGYQVIQNREAFGLFHDMTQDTDVKFTAAGALTHAGFDVGSRIYAVAQEPAPMMVGPDELYRVYLMISSHDGSSGLTVMSLLYRSACSNGLIMYDKSKSNIFRIRHSSNYQENIRKAKYAMTLAQDHLNNLYVDFNEMATESFGIVEMHNLTEQLFPATIAKKGPGLVEEAETVMQVSHKAQKAREIVNTLFHKGMGHENIQNTKWAAINAVAEYADHFRTAPLRTGADAGTARFNATLLGTGAKLKQDAYNLLTA